MLTHQFHVDAAQGSGILISTCSLNPSGCHDFCRCLAAELKLDFIEINFHILNMGRTPFFKPNEADKWKKIFLSGCQAKNAANIIKKLNFTAIEVIYIIIPPWQSKRSGEYYNSLCNAFRTEFSSVFQKSYLINLLTSGIDCKADHCIGLPRPYPVLESKYEIDTRCFGLMYIRHPDSLLRTVDDNYLRAYFNQISLAAKAKGYKKKISILAIGINSHHIEIQKIADVFSIAIKPLERLPQGDFIQTMKRLAKKGGVFLSDGVQSLMQGLYIGTKIFFYNASGKPGNGACCEQLVQAISPEYQSIASVLLGLSRDYDLLKDQQKVMTVYQSLQSLIRAGIKKFEDDRITCSATTDLIESKNVAIQSTATLFSRKLTTVVKTASPEKDPAFTPTSLMKYPG